MINRAVATFNYPTPYWQNAADPLPTYNGGGVAGTFSSTVGLVFVNTTTGEIDLSASTPGTYVVTNSLQALAPCPANTATANITNNSNPTASILGDTTICSGNNTTLTANGGGTYLWNTNETTNALTVSPVTTSDFFVIVSNTICKDTATIHITVISNPIAITNADTTICSGTPIEIYALGGGTYSWLPTTWLSCNDCQNPTATPEDNIRYCVTVTTNGCSDSACFDVEIFCKYFYIPSAFTPNNNGLNEDFKPKIAGVHDYRFIIFNRWGEKIFETLDIEEGWNGSYQGTASELDVYVYKIIFTDDTKNKQHQYIGKVTLLR